MVQGLKDSLNDYIKGDKASAKTKALKAYLEGFEPMEDRLRAIDSKFVPIVERQIHKARKAIEKDEGEASVTAEINKSLELIEQANQMLAK